MPTPLDLLISLDQEHPDEDEYMLKEKYGTIFNPLSFSSFEYASHVWDAKLETNGRISIWHTNSNRFIGCFGCLPTIRWALKSWVMYGGLE